MSCAAPAAQAQIVCLPIDHVEIQDAPSLTSDELQQLVAGFEGRCLGLAEFDQVLETVTLAYVDSGLILSRAYLPEQDLTSGTLQIKAVEGTLSEININGEDRPYWAGMVFPGLVGEPVNIRETEQGLDQIEAMPRWTAELSFAPSEVAGESVLQVTAATSKRTEFRFSSNNRGNEDTGEWISSLSANTTNLFGLNDTWDISASKSVNPNPFALAYDGDTNRSASLGLSVPYGRWSIDYDYSFSDYVLTIPGAIDLINTDGSVRTHSLSIDYLLERNETTKQVLGFSLVRAQNENFIQDVRIDASSRTLTGFKLSYGQSTPLWSGSFDGTVYAERGLRIFNGENGDSLPEGSPEPQYFLLGFDVDYARQLGATQRLAWSSTISAQLSTDRLYGTQAFSIGGTSTVRGSRTSMASGSSGIVWRNEFEYQILREMADFIPYAALYGAVDYGRIFRQAKIDVTSAHAVGTTVGVKLRDTAYNVDLSYQEVVSASGHIEKPSGTVFATFEIVF
jgi:hemolysin activation/secretion protein